MPSRNIPKVIYFVSCTELTPTQADYIRLWAYHNKNYRVELWHDSTALVDQVTFNRVYNYVIERDFSDVNSNSSPMKFSTTMQAEWRRIKSDIATEFTKSKKKDYKQATIEVFKKRSVDLEGTLEQLVTRQDTVLRMLEKSKNIEVFDISDLPFNSVIKQTNTVKVYEELRHTNAYQLSELILSYNLLENSGGFYIGKGVLPDLNSNLITEELRTDDVQGNLIKKVWLKLAIEKMSHGSDSFLEGSIGLSLYDEPELSTLEGDHSVEHLRARIDSLSLTENQFFISLDQATPQDKNKIFFENYHGTMDVTTPALIGVKAQSGVFRHLMNDYGNLCTLNLLTKDRGKTPRQIYGEIKSSLVDYYRRKGITLEDSELQRITHTVLILEDLPFTRELDPYGDALGVGALKRAFRRTNKYTVGSLFQLQHFGLYEYKDFKNKDIATLTPTRVYQHGLTYDSIVIISLDGRRDTIITGHTLYKKEERVVEKTYHLHYDNSEKKPLFVEGRRFTPGEKTKIIILGHGNNNRIGSLSANELAKILKDVIPRGVTVKRVALWGCSIAESTLGTNGIITDDNKSLVPELLRYLSKSDRFTADLTSIKYPVQINVFGNKIFRVLEGSKFRGEQTTTVFTRKPEHRRFIFKLMGSGHISYMVKSGLDALAPEIQALSPRLQDIDPNNNLQSEILRSAINWKVDVSHRDVLFSADKSAIVYGMAEPVVDGKIVVAEKTAINVVTVRRALFLVGIYDTFDEWLTKIPHQGPEKTLSREIEKIVNKYHGDPSSPYHIPEIATAYDRLRQRVISHKFSFVSVDPTSTDGASILYSLFPEGFSRINIALLCRSRRAIGTNGCNSINEEVESLKLLSDEDTIITTTGDIDAKDILLTDHSQNSRMTDLQSGIREFRLSRATSRLNWHEDHHNLVAIDQPAFEQAETLAAESHTKINALLLDQQNSVLIKRDGSVVLKLSGGNDNKLSLVGSSSSFNQLRANDLTGWVRQFVNGAHIGSLNILLSGTDDSFESLATWVDPDSLSQLKGVSTTINFQIMDPGKRATPSYPIKINRLDTNTLFTNWGGDVSQRWFESSRPQPGLPALKPESFLDSERVIFSSVTVQYAQEFKRLSYYLGAFETGILKLKATNNRLSVDYFPLLDSFRPRKGGSRGWQIKFRDLRPDNNQKVRVLVRDPELIASLNYFKGRFTETKQALKKVQTRRLSKMDVTGDGFGHAMTFGSMIYQMFRNDALEDRADHAPVTTGSQSRILRAQIVFGSINEQIQTVDALLTLGKYARGIIDKKFLTFTERMANALQKSTRVSSSMATAGKVSIPLGSRLLRASGPGANIVLSGVTIGLDIAALSACDTKNCRENAGITLGLDLAASAPIFVAVGAKALGSAGLISLSTAGAISSAASTIALPVAFLATLLIIGESLRQQDIQEFEANMDFWQEIYESLILKGAWNQDTQTLNLYSKRIGVYEDTGRYRYREESSTHHSPSASYCIHRTVKERIYQWVSKDVSRLTPITQIDFRQRQIGYGRINIHKVINDGDLHSKSGLPIHRRLMKGGYGCNNDYGVSNHVFNLLGHEEVLEQLKSNLIWPDQPIKRVILPSTRDWTLARWDNFTKSINGATTWGLSGQGRDGWKMLMNASKKKEAKNGVNPEFLFAYHSYIPEPADANKKAGSSSCSNRSNNREMVYILKDLTNSNNITPANEPQTIHVYAAPHDQEFYIHDQKTTYVFHGGGNYNYTVVMLYGGRAKFHRVANEQWSIILKNERQRIWLNQYRNIDSHITLPMNDGFIEFHNFGSADNGSFPVTVIDDYRYRYHVLDSQGQFKLYYPEISDASQLSDKERFFLIRDYRYPQTSHSVNVPMRFHRLSQFQWLDIEPEEATQVSISATCRYSMDHGSLTTMSPPKAVHEDTMVVGGSPDRGYLFYSASGQKLYYRPPLDSSIQEVTEIPGQYDSRIDLHSDNLQGFFKSLNGVVYHLEKIVRHNNNNTTTFLPAVKAVKAVWIRANYLEPIAEIKRFLEPDHPIPVQVLSKEGSQRASTVAFLDLRANQGNGTVITWNPLSKNFLVDNEVTPDSQAAINRELSPLRFSKNQLEVTLFYKTSNNASDIYLFLDSTGRIQLLDTGQPPIKQYIHKPKQLTVNFGFNDRFRTITKATYSHLNNNEVLFTLDDDVVIGTHTSTLDRKFRYDNPPPFVNFELRNESSFRIRAVQYDSSWGVRSATSVSNLIREKLSPYSRFTHSDELVPDFLVIHNYIPSEYSDDHTNTISWYITSHNHIYVTSEEINLLGYDHQLSILYAFNHSMKQVMFVDLTGIDTDHDDWPQLSPYSHSRYEYSNLFLSNGAVYGLDHNGNTYLIEQSTGEASKRILVKMDLTSELQPPDQAEWSRSLLKTEVMRIVQARIEWVSRLKDTELDEDLKLELGPNLSQYKCWFHTSRSKVAPEGLYIFDGREQVVFLGATRTGGTERAWFYSSSDGMLFQQDNNVSVSSSAVAALGPFSDITIEQGKNSVAITGTSGDDRFPDIRLGAPASDTVLHLSSGGGSDTYSFSQEMLAHYNFIVIDNSIIKAGHPAHMDSRATPPPRLSSVVSIQVDLPANEFSAILGNQSLQLYHFRTGHSLFLSDSYNWYTQNKSMAGQLNFTSNLKYINFIDFRISLNELTGHLLKQPNEFWQFPIDASFLIPENSRIAHPDHPFILNLPKKYQLKNFIKLPSRSGWTLTVKPKGQSKTFTHVSDPNLMAAISGRFFIDRHGSHGELIPIHLSEFKSPETQGLLTSDLTPLSRLQESREQLVQYEDIIFKFPHQSDKTLLLDSYTYSELIAEDLIRSSRRDMARIQISDSSANKTSTLIRKPSTVVFAFDDILKGWPIESMDTFIHDHSGPFWLETDSNPFLKKKTSDNFSAAASSGNPVFYNLNPHHVKVYLHRGKHWRIKYRGQLMQKIKRMSNEGALTLTLAQKGSDGIRSASQYLVMSYPFKKWRLHSGPDMNSPFYLGRDNAYGVVLSPLNLMSGFIPENELAGLLLAKSLGRYDGVYFRDGLRSYSELAEHLSQQPLTRVTGQLESDIYQFTGNPLNNVIPVYVTADNEYSVNGGSGNDFIRVTQAIKSKIKTVKNGLNRATRTFLRKPQVTADGGDGDDILDLSAPVRVMVQGSSGNDSVFISSSSQADLVHMRQGSLFIRGLMPEQVVPLLLKRRKNGRYKVVTKPNRATDIFIRVRTQNNRKYQLIARISQESLRHIHFQNGTYIDDVSGWLTGQSVIKNYQARTSTSTTPQYSTESATTLSTFSESTEAELPSTTTEASSEETEPNTTPQMTTSNSVGLTEGLLSEPDEPVGKIEQITEQLESAKRYFNTGEDSIRGMESQEALNRLIQDMVQFNATREGSLSTTSSTMSTAFTQSTALSASALNNP